MIFWLFFVIPVALWLGRETTEDRGPERVEDILARLQREADERNAKAP